MPNYQITFIFDLPGHGFTESWWVTDDRTNLDVIKDDLAIPVARARMKLASEDCTLQAIRISNGAEDGKVGKTYYEPITGVEGKRGAASNVSINAQFGTQNNDYQKLTQIRGFWDEWELNGGALAKNDEALKAAFTSYVAEIQKKKFGWRSIVSRLTFDVTAYTVSASDFVTLTLAPRGGALPDFPGNRVALISGVNVKSTLNGTQIVRKVAPNQVELVKPIAAGPFLSKGKLVLPSFGYRIAANGTMQRIGKRQAGAPLLRSRGRRSARPRV